MMKKCCAFLAGIALGAAVTALVTPKSGKELQEQLITKANELQKKVKEFDIKDLSFNETRDVLKEKLDEIKAAIEDFDWAESKEKVSKKFDEVSARLSEIKVQLKETKEVAIDEASEEKEIIDVTTATTL